ncbi:MAG: Hsp20/alpha crystallin family protein [Promethearchaeota archaeon]
MPDEFDDFIDAIKKYFKIDSDMVDVDFLFIPESKNNLNLDSQNNMEKGFKISYHFEAGMKKPEFKFEGNVDNKKIRDIIKNLNLSKYPTSKKRFESSSQKEIDVKQLSLDIPEQEQVLAVAEPLTEINDYKEYSEIILDIPGINKEDVRINIIEKGTKLLFTAENSSRKYKKIVSLPFKASTNNYEVEVKNGLAIINLKKLYI